MELQRIDEITEACARAAHEMNRVYCLTIGEHQPSWEEAPEWAKESARKGVAGALAGNTPEQSHRGWLDEKERTGWKYGPVKDAAAKTHPCMVPYAELPAEQRAKDTLFLMSVRALHAALTRPARVARDVVDDDCVDFTPGAPGGSCDGDGHYKCRECVNLDRRGP